MQFGAGSSRQTPPQTSTQEALRYYSEPFDLLKDAASTIEKARIHIISTQLIHFLKLEDAIYLEDSYILDLIEQIFLDLKDLATLFNRRVFKDQRCIYSPARSEY